MKDNMNKIIKMVILYGVLLFIILSMVNISYGMILDFSYTTIQFKNITSESNVYALVGKENNKNNDMIGEFANLMQMSVEEELMSILKNQIFIEEEYKNNSFSDGLENTNQEIVFEGKTFDKIKINKDVWITYVDNVLFAKIDGSNINSININDSKYWKYHIERDNYGGDTINRCFLVYDSKEETITDVTEKEIKDEDIFVRTKIRQKEKFKILKKFLKIVLIAIVLGTATGLLIYYVQRGQKNKS